ncbi:APLF factor, partial [Penelope pileata]|nr:APLF factor [Penelope pileata]
MAGVRLAPADGGCPVALPPGETLLGRGPLLGITDKRVSRKHAVLEVMGGQVRIKPIHVDSCFYQSPENGRLLPLEAHEWHSLKFGDSFSLMIDKYIFKVLSAQPVESTERNHQEAEEAAAASVQPIEMSCSPALTEPGCSTSETRGTTKMRKNDSASTHLVSPCNSDGSEQSKSILRKRVLPSWMLEKDLLVQRISEPVTKGDGRQKRNQGRGESNMESLKSEVTVLRRKRSASGEITGNFKDEEQDEEERSCLSTPSSQNASGFPLESAMRNMDGNGKTETKKSGSSMEKSDRQLHSKRCKPDQTSSQTNRTEESENKGQLTGSASQQALWSWTSQYSGAQKGTHEPSTDLDYEADISHTTRSVEASESSKQIKRKRTPCMYGTGCYRKNPVHFQQFSHPDDDDYYETDNVTQDNNDNRPECPYGTACYRKNPQHKLEYKHTVPPGKKSLEKDSDNDGEPNECDLNDSFIDDEEEECEPTDEDSDWEPSSEDKDNEDVETLVKEAHRFVKTKK